MSSDLYYSNLGVRNPAILRSIVVSNLWDFRQYLFHAEKRMKSRIYSYSYKLKSIIIKIDSPANENKADIFSADLISLDPYGKQKLKAINIEKRELTVDANALNSSIYGHFDDDYVEYDFSVKEVTISNIEPFDLTEDEEDDALDLLFESSSIYDSSDSESRGKRISIIGKDPRNRTIKLTEVPKYNPFWVHYNAYILQRQREAVEELAVHPKKHLLPILNLLQTWEHVKWGSFESIEPKKYFVLTDESKDGCAEQRTFVKMAMGTPDIAILEGPPGSGKTTTLLELIAQEILRGKRVLMVASTHVAVDNIIERIVAHRDKEEKKSLLNVCGIVPLRIGDEGNVSEEVRKYCLNNLVATEKNRLIDELKVVFRKDKSSKAQKNLYEDLVSNNSKSDDIIKTLLIDSANLICGTTIGILQTPIVKEKSNSSEPLFDVVILDEASKTTFQEFLVPALYGKKWILSGDVKQLSPYVDRDTVVSNLKNLKGFSGPSGYLDKQVCLDAFSVSKSYNNPNSKAAKIGKLVFKDIDYLDEYRTRMNEQLEGLDNLFKNNNEGESCEVSFTSVHKKPVSLLDKLEISGSNLIVTTRYLQEDILPFLPFNLDTTLDEIYERRKRAYIGSKNYESLSHDSQSWEDQIEWRIARLHELETSDPKYERLKFEIKLLLPYFKDHVNDTVSKKISRDKVMEKDIHSIRRIALPSILELLQSGFEADESKKFNRTNDIALYSGLGYGKAHQDVLDSRHVLLEHQHRMHPDISEFPREQFYEGNALKDATGIANKRSWSYGHKYPSRIVWIDVRPQSSEYTDRKTSFNLAEVNQIIIQLQEFMDWAKNNPCQDENDGYWSIALLSFYKGQTKKISEHLKQIKAKYGLSGSFNDYISRECNVTVKISTVDRFQGHEADIVFLSFVRAKRSSFGFLDNTNRLNVALTRARYQLVIVGDKKKFERAKVPILRNLAKNTVEGPIQYRRGETTWT